MRDEPEDNEIERNSVADTPAYMKADELPWTPWVTKGLFFKLISVDMSTGGFSVFLKVLPGHHLPTHGLGGSLEGIVLAGSFGVDDAVSKKGDFFFDYGGSFQQPLSEEGCTLFLSCGGPLFGLDAETGATVPIDARLIYDMASAAGVADHIGPVFD